MKEQFRSIFVVLALVALTLSGCGGGGGATTGPAAAKMVTGVAATGAPIAGVVMLKDSSPTPVQLIRTTASDGSFAFNTSGLTPPFIIKTTAAAINLYSLAGDNGIYNVTPLTTMAVAQAAGGADLDALYNQHVQSAISAAVSKMPDAVTAVQNNLAPLLNSFGVTNNILTGKFSANHTGVDALLDAISVSIVNGTVTITNKQNSMVVYTAPCSNLAAGSVVTSNMPTPPMAPAPAPASGAAIYTSRCAGCHGDIGNSTLKGRASVTAIQTAIASNLGGMGMLNGISSADIQAVSDVLMAPAGGNPTPTPTPVPPVVPPAQPDGATLYATNCAGCHGALATSSKLGVTVVRIQNAISGNVGGMSKFASLTAADLQAIATALNPPAPTPAPVPTPTPTPVPAPDGVALYASNCAGCHGPLATSSKQGVTLARLQGAIANNTGGMSILSTLTAAQQQAIVAALAPATPSPTPAPAPVPTPTPDGAALYASNCAGCHGPLATSTKLGITIARLQNAIANNTGGMSSLSGLTVTQVQAIVTALTPATPTPTPTPTPVLDGTVLYASSCAGCHGVLASSAKAGATASRIQTAINSNTGGMGALSTLTPAQVSAIATALAGVTPSPTPTPACGSCHAIPPATGHHSTHLSEGIVCATCHGAGYSTTTVVAATHDNGVVNLTSTIGWDATNRTCANSCHGTHAW